MQTLTVVSFCLCLAFALASLPACDKAVINSITEYWAEKGTPQNVMESLAKKGKGTLVYSTAIVPLLAAPSSQTKCINGEFTKDTAKFTAVLKTGELDASKAAPSLKVSEKNGVITEEGGKVIKYIISNDEGITAFYTCDPKSKKLGEPAVGLAVAKSQYAASKDAIKSTKSTLENFGFELVTAYSQDCAN